MKSINKAFVAASALVSLGFISSGQANAAVIVLTFEGVANETPVGSYYAPDYIFSPATLALVDADAGGSGNFANEPSANTVMFFTDANNAILNVTNGFSTGFSFFYSSSTAASVNVWSGLNASGSLLGTIALAPQHTTNCAGDPSGTFCNWTNAGVTFAGIASSIDFGGTASATGFDDITFGSDVAGAVPEPSTWAMLLLGFGAVGGALRIGRKKRLTASFA